MEGEGTWERGGKAEGLNAMCFAGLEIVMCACQRRDTTSTNIITNDSGMYGGMTDEAVTAINWHGIWIDWIWATNNEGSIDDRLIAHHLGLEELGSSAVGRTAKC